MFSSLFDGLDKFISGADRLGALSASGVWAFFCLVFIIYIFWDLRQKKVSAEAAWKARLEEARADTLMAVAIEKLASEIQELRYKIDGGPHV